MLRRSSWETGRTTPIRPAAQESPCEAGWSSRRASPVTTSDSDAVGSSSRGGGGGAAGGAGGGRVERVGILVVPSLSGHRVLELAHPGSERPPELRELLRADDQDGDDQDDHQLEGSDVWHLANVLRNGCTRITTSANAPVLPAARRGVKPLASQADEVPIRGNQDMNTQQPDNTPYVRRVVLPSGKTIE